MRARALHIIFQWTGKILVPLFFGVTVLLWGPSLAHGDVTATPPAVHSDDDAGDVAAAVEELRASITYQGENDGIQTNDIEYTAVPSDQEKIFLNFEGVDLRTVLLLLADITGYTILPEPGVSGEVTIINPQPVTPEEAMQIIFSILEMQGFTIVEHDHLVKIIRAGQARHRPIRTMMQPESIEDLDEDDTIRAQVVYPRYISPADVQNFLTPLLSQGVGQIMINEPTGAVIIIDTGANIKRLMEIMQLIDREIVEGQIDIRIHMLEYADENEMVQMLERIFQSPVFQDPMAQRITVDGAAAPTPDVPAPPRPEGDAPSPTELELGRRTMATFIAETRMHAIIIISARRNFPLIMEIISRLDVPSIEKDDTVHIYPLQHVKAEEISETLNRIFAERPTTTAGRGTVGRAEERVPDRRDIRRSQPPTREAAPERTAAIGAAGGSITHLAGKVDVLYDEPSNSLIVITSPRHYEMVRRIIQRLDRRTPQAWIQAMIVEVSRNKDYNYGVGWQNVLKDKNIFGGDSDMASLVQALDTTIGPAFDEALQEVRPGRSPGLSYSYGKIDKHGRYSPYMTLQIAEGVSDINVLSTPSILASNNKEAEIRIGQQFPIPRYSRGSSADYRDFSYEYTDISIELTVTPRINRYREVALETMVSVRDSGGQAYADELSPPIVLQRDARTEVVVQDGQTLVIGGLIKDDFTTTTSKIPLLGDIPLIKHAFRSQSYNKKKTELLIFITPYVVETDIQGDTLTAGIRDSYRGVDSFIDNRDRELLYDHVNVESSELTIYDDWREFEKKIEYAQRYFNLPQSLSRQQDIQERERAQRFFTLPDLDDKEAPRDERLLFDSDDAIEEIRYDDTGWRRDTPAPQARESESESDTLHHLTTLLDRERALLYSP